MVPKPTKLINTNKYLSQNNGIFCKIEVYSKNQNEDSVARPIAVYLYEICLTNHLKSSIQLNLLQTYI